MPPNKLVYVFQPYILSVRHAAIKQNVASFGAAPLLGGAEVEGFLTHLAVARHVAANGGRGAGVMLE